MPVTVSKFNSLHSNAVNGAIDLDDASASAFKLMLLSASYTPNLNHQTVADIVANEIANGNGYTSGGKALTGVTLTRPAAIATFDADDVIWTASGGSITASYAALYYNAGAGSDAQRELITLIDFGGAQSAGDGTDFRIVWPVAGILQIQ